MLLKPAATTTPSSSFRTGRRGTTLLLAGIVVSGLLLAASCGTAETTDSVPLTGPAEVFQPGAHPEDLIQSTPQDCWAADGSHFYYAMTAGSHITRFVYGVCVFANPNPNFADPFPDPPFPEP